MDAAKKVVIDATTEIVVAKMSNSGISPNRETGKSVADFYQEIYNKILEISTT